MFIWFNHRLIVRAINIAARSSDLEKGLHGLFHPSLSVVMPLIHF
jgi:hypothetical protein